MQKLPPSLARDRFELEFQSALGAALMITHGWTANETGDAFRVARELSERLDDPQRLAESLIGLFNVYQGQGLYKDALATVNQLIEQASATCQDAYELVGHYLRENVLLSLGQFEAACQDGERVVALVGWIFNPPRKFLQSFHGLGEWQSRSAPRSPGCGLRSWSIGTA